MGARRDRILQRWLAAGVVLGLAVFVGALTFFHWIGPAASGGREQPIAFSHRLHVTDKQIDCAYCHSFARRSINAGLPPVETCLGCHRHIIPGHPEIVKLRSYERDMQNLPWVRVFYNPDHVFFPHYRHILKEVACAECHGAVETMDRLETHTFYMGFCLDCHHVRQASRECTACHQ
jgi:hypothetical protein